MSSAQGQNQEREALLDDPEAVNNEADKAPSPAPAKGKKIDPLIGRSIGGRYVITERIGAGGMGVVYKAKQGAVDRNVAIKVLLTRPAEKDDEYETLVRRFHLEARAASKLSHPNTITIYDFGQDEDGLLYIAMEFLDGISLDRVLKQGALTPQRAVRVIMQLCHSLSEAHKKGIVHRDIKPDNIFLINLGGDNDFVKVLDFGVAKLRESSNNNDKTLTKAGMIFGTPKYMSPEQARCMPLDARSDIYAVGVMMYQLLTGAVPFDAEDHVSILLMHCSEPPEPFAKRRPDLQLPPELEAVVFKAMMKDRDARYQSVDEMAAALEMIAAKFQFVANTSMLPIVSGYATSSNPAVTPLHGSYTPPPTQLNTLPNTEGFNLADTLGPDPTSMGMAAANPSGATATPTPSNPLTRPSPQEAGLTESGSYAWDGGLKLNLGATPPHGSPAPAAAVAPSRPGQNTLVIAGGAALALVLLLVVAFFAFGDKNNTDPDPPAPTPPELSQKSPVEIVPAVEDAGIAEATPDAAEEAPDAAAVAQLPDAATQDKQAALPDGPQVSISITTDPEGAEVTFDGVVLPKTTPVTIQRPLDEKARPTLILKLKGHKSVTKRVALNKDSELALTLKKGADASQTGQSGNSALPDPDELYKNKP